MMVARQLSAAIPRFVTPVDRQQQVQHPMS
jgi:hypothetical protein